MTWLDDRSNDICYYNGRYYEISNYQIRGRIREDVIVGVTCTETYPEDEFTFDYGPMVPPSPITPTTSVPYGQTPYGTGPYGGSRLTTTSVPYGQEPYGTGSYGGTS